MLKARWMALALLFPLFAAAYSPAPSKTKGPMFYAAEFADEPYYSNQDTLTYSCMSANYALGNYRGNSVKVAVIDSGINYAHEDFKNGGVSIVQGASRSIEYDSGWKYYPYSSYPSHLNDTLGHGSNVASVIASQINDLGCAGLAPNVDLYVYKVTNSDNGYEWTAIINALQYCIDNHMDVVNMSFQAYEHAVSYGGSSMGASSGCSTVLHNSLTNCRNAGITLVGAAGNFNTDEPSYPASDSNVISVGSLAKSSMTAKAGYSNLYGIDLVAPGSVYVADKGSTSSYKETQGTSFSAPIVTAAIALYKQLHRSATPAQIESALYASCDSLTGTPSWSGHGRLNLDRFLGMENGRPTSLTLDDPSSGELELTVGDTQQLEWTVGGVGSFDDSVIFETLEDNVITVSDTGLVTAIGSGEDYISITSTVDPSLEAEVYVNVLPPATITATCDKVFSVGESITFADITVKDDRDNVLPFTFEDDGYVFTYEDSLPNGAVKTKSFSVTVGGEPYSFDVSVKRASYVAPVQDQMTSSISGASGTSYKDFNGKTLSSGAVYAGNAAAGNSAIQLRSSSNSGIVMTGASSSTPTSVSLVWQASTSNGRTVTVYGKNEPYSSAADLYNASTQGTSLGTIVKGTSTSLAVSGYRYLGFRSANNSLYVTSLTIDFSKKDAENIANFIMFSDTGNQCATKFGQAKTIFESLSKAERVRLMENGAYTLTKARERLLYWAAHEKASITKVGDDYVISVSSLALMVPSTLDRGASIALIALGVTAAAITGFAFARRKKTH